MVEPVAWMNCSCNVIPEKRGGTCRAVYEDRLLMCDGCDGKDGCESELFVWWFQRMW